MEEQKEKVANLFQKLMSMAGSLSIKYKILLGFVFVILMSVGSTLFNQKQLTTIKHNFLSINDQLKSYSYAKELKSATLHIQDYLLSVSTTKGQDGFDTGFAKAEEWHTNFQATADEYLALAKKLEDKDLIAQLEEIKPYMTDTYNEGKSMAENYMNQGIAEGNAVYGIFAIYVEDITDRMNAIADLAQKNIITSLESSTKLATEVINVSLIVLAILVIISISVSLAIANLITGPIVALNNLFQELAKGELSVQAEIKANDEIGRMSEAFNKSVANLRALKEEEQRRAEQERENLAIATQRSQMLENMPLSFFSINLKSEIDYANPAAKAIISKLNIGLADDNISGYTYANFHKDPSKLINLISDPANLPYTEVIDAGNEKIEVLVNPIFDNENNYNNAMVSWTVVTEKYVSEQRDQMVKDELKTNVQSLTGSVNLMEQKSESLASNISGIIVGAEELQTYISSVSSASGQMISSIKEISGNTERAASMTSSTVSQMSETEGMVFELQERSKEIGEIIKVVNSIANQTNLLALNATIEAARAGEAGKGFAVVANEVKELANKTSVATDDINNQIIAIQKQTTDALVAIKNSVNSVESINEITNTIASAVEEQTAVTSEIGRSMELSFEKVNNVSEDVTQISDLMQENKEQVSVVNDVSDKLEALT